MRREDAGSDLGRTKEESRVLQVEASEVGGRTAELDRQETATTGVTADAAAMAEVGLAQADEAVPTEVVMSHPAADKAAAGEVATVNASSNPASQEDSREVVKETAKEALVGTGEPEPSEMAAWASSSLEPAPSVQADMPASGTEIGAAAGPLLFGATSGSEKVSQEPHTTRTVRSDYGKASPTPRATAKDASGGRSSQLRPGLELVVKVPSASSKRNGRTLLPAPGLVEVVKPRATT
jgi:hypothetical protein